MPRRGSSRATASMSAVRSNAVTSRSPTDSKVPFNWSAAYCRCASRISARSARNTRARCHSVSACCRKPVPSSSGCVWRRCDEITPCHSYGSIPWPGSSRASSSSAAIRCVLQPEKRSSANASQIDSRGARPAPREGPHTLAISSRTAGRCAAREDGHPNTASLPCSGGRTCACGPSARGRGYGAESCCRATDVQPHDWRRTTSVSMSVRSGTSSPRSRRSITSAARRTSLSVGNSTVVRGGSTAWAISRLSKPARAMSSGTRIPRPVSACSASTAIMSFAATRASKVAFRSSSNRLTASAPEGEKKVPGATRLGSKANPDSARLSR